MPEDPLLAHVSLCVPKNLVLRCIRSLNELEGPYSGWVALAAGGAAGGGVLFRQSQGCYFLIFRMAVVWLPTYDQFKINLRLIIHK